MGTRTYMVVSKDEQGNEISREARPVCVGMEASRRGSLLKLELVGGFTSLIPKEHKKALESLQKSVAQTAQVKRSGDGCYYFPAALERTLASALLLAGFEVAPHSIELSEEMRMGTFTAGGA